MFKWANKPPRAGGALSFSRLAIYLPKAGGNLHATSAGTIFAVQLPVGGGVGGMGVLSQTSVTSSGVARSSSNGPPGDRIGHDFLWIIRPVPSQVLLCQVSFTQVPSTDIFQRSQGPWHRLHVFCSSYIALKMLIEP